MPVLALKDGSPLGSFAGGMPETRLRWHKGEEREVSQGTADYLLEAFPDVFEVVSSVAAEVGAPEVDKAMKSPAKKASRAKKAPAKKKASK